ncbi:hypothetical protein KKC32_00395 [Patescibacteria group bacterium]|nr:hypothetical protein [Patescibacteria group bacterium]
MQNITKWLVAIIFIIAIALSAFFFGFYTAKTQMTDALREQIENKTIKDIQTKLELLPPYYSSTQNNNLLIGTIKEINNSEIILSIRPQTIAEALTDSPPEKNISISAKTKIFYQTIKENFDFTASPQTTDTHLLKKNDLRVGEMIYAALDPLETNPTALEIKVNR